MFSREGRAIRPSNKNASYSTHRGELEYTWFGGSISSPEFSRTKKRFFVFEYIINKKGKLIFEMFFLAREERYDRQTKTHPVVLIKTSWTKKKKKKNRRKKKKKKKKEEIFNKYTHSLKRKSDFGKRRRGNLPKPLPMSLNIKW